MNKHKEDTLKKMDIGTWIAFFIIAVYSLTLVYLLFFCLLTALKDNYDFALDHNVFGLPNWKEYPFSFVNFENAFEYMKIQIKGRLYATVGSQFLYGILYAVGSTFVGVFSKVFVAYFCSKYDTKFGKIIYATAIVVMILPIVGGMASSIMLMRGLQLYDTLYGILLYNASFYGMYFLVFYAAFKGVSNAYGEAAKIDGAGHFAIFFKIYLPMIFPSIMAVAIMMLISFWNDYQTPLVYLPSMPTISYGLHRFSQTSRADNAPALLSAALIVCVPILIMFVIFKDKMMGNITAGGLKG